MKEKQILADAMGSAKVENRKHYLSLYLIILSITGFLALSFYFSRGTFEAAPKLQPKCGGLLAGDNGEFEYSPPSLPTGNPAKSCVWLIQAYDSSDVRLTLQAFKGKEGSTVMLYKESEPGQIHLHPIVLSPESVGKTVDAPGSAFVIILPQADSSSISFRWDSSPANYSPSAYRVTIAEYMGIPAKRLAWQPHRTQERLWWIISGGAGNEVPTDGVEYKIKAEQNGCTQPCSCLAFQAFQVNGDGFLEEFVRECGINSSGGKFKVNSYPLIIAASANTTLQGATRVELYWPSGRNAEPPTSTVGLETAISYTNAHPPDGPEIYLTTNNFEGSELKAFSLASSAVRSVVNTTVSIKAMTLDPNNQQIYFSSQGTIYCMDVNGRTVHKVFSMGSLDETFGDLAFDHVNGLLYALTDEGGIIACNQTTVGNMSNGTWICIRILHSIAPINETVWYHSVALNPAKGEMYVGTETGGLLRAEMDGSNVETIFKGITKVAGIVVDVDGNSTQLYWVGSWNDRIQRAKLDGSGRVETVVQLPEGTGPWDMIKINDTLYWSTFANEECVQAIRVTGEDLRVVYNGNHSISRLTAAVTSNIKNNYDRVGHVRSPCKGHVCSHMCVPKASQSFRCICPEGMHLLEDGKTCAN